MKKENNERGTSPLFQDVKPAKPIILDSAPSKVSKMVKNLPDKRDLLVAHILFGPPKSLE